MEAPCLAAASLINYEQTRRKESRHKDRRLCGIVRGVITFMEKTSREAGQLLTDWPEEAN